MLSKVSNLRQTRNRKVCQNGYVQLGDRRRRLPRSHRNRGGLLARHSFAMDQVGAAATYAGYIFLLYN